MEEVHEFMKGSTTKVGKFRLSGWKDNVTGVVTEYFGDGQPDPATMTGSTKQYDIILEKTTTTTPVVA